jgi:ABC-type bacteriocin/lantibiotic exporter with double-glycine peptidase domain
MEQNTKTAAKTRVLVILSLFGLLLFLASTVFPFLLEHRTTTWIFARDSVSYWSFKSSTQHFVLGEPRSPTAESWFYSYWVEINEYRTGLAAILVLMFLVQIVTLVTSSVHIFTTNRVLAVASARACVILVSIVIALMTYVNNSVSHPWSNSIDMGYVSAFLSLLVWLLVSILSYFW